MNEREKIYNKTDGHCYYCGCKLPDRWHADHIKPIHRNRPDESLNKYGVDRGEDTIENKVPACPRCNIRKGTLTVEKFREEISKQVDRLKRDSSQFRIAMDYGLIEEQETEVEFYFEQLTPNTNG